MSRVKVRRSPEVTLPEEAWAKLGVAEGDELDVEVVEEGVLLRRVAAVEREKAWDDLMEIVATPKWRGPGPEPGEDEVLELAVEEIHAMRREDDDESRP
jgi:AbrB family looped-hinge helix DNA binding protein